LINARRPGVSNQSSLRYDFTVFLTAEPDEPRNLYLQIA
jgi:hypothetical protein